MRQLAVAGAEGGGGLGTGVVGGGLPTSGEAGGGLEAGGGGEGLVPPTGWQSPEGHCWSGGMVTSLLLM